MTTTFLILHGILMVVVGSVAMVSQLITTRDSRIVYQGDEAVKLGRWVLFTGITEILLFCILNLFLILSR